MYRFYNFIPKRYLSNVSNILDRKQLLYRSKQRGWLEVDIILGSWANDNIMKLSNIQLSEYKKILNLETTDIYNIILDIKPKPDDLDSEVVSMIQKYAKEELKINTPLNYEITKKKMSN